MNRVGKGLDYLRQTFPCKNDAKIKEGFFLGRQIKEVFKTPTSKINWMLPRKGPGAYLKTYAGTFWEIKIRKLSRNRVINCFPNTVPWCETCRWNSISCNPTWIFSPGNMSRLWRAQWKLPSGYIPNGKKIQRQMEHKYVDWSLLDSRTGYTNRRIQETKDDKAFLILHLFIFGYDTVLWTVHISLKNILFIFY